jgi:Dolichyl-phosphate-mannose-protein mannosyltransferase
MEYGTVTGWGDSVSPPQSAGPSAREGGPKAPAVGGSAPTGAPVARGTVSHLQERMSGWGVPGWWPLLAVLAVQMAFSLRLVRADTAFQDEALYLWAGHREWAHWLHGASVPPFAAYFSGAPVIYPPLGAAADSVGGLVGARVLSLAFMLGATVLLWGTATRLFGRRAAFFAAALFAVLASTLHLGSFATYDAMSVFLVGLAAWCVVRAGDRQDATGWMVAAGAALVLANAAAYSSALFDPVVVVLALVTAFPKPGGRLAVGRIVILLTVVITALLAGLLIGGSSYLVGVEQTTVARVGGLDSPLTVLADAWSWTGVIIVLAVCGVAVSWIGGERRAQTWLLAVLAAAALLGPFEQASLHTLASLNKHVGLGAWFAAIAAGYAIDRFIVAAPVGRTRALTCGAFVIALVFPLSLGVGQSRVFSTNWPNAGSFIAILRPLTAHTSGRLLIEDPSIAEYYLPAGSQWRRWSSTRNIVLPSGASTGGPTKAQGVVGPGNAAIFARYIAKGYFSLVALNFADTTALDHRITADLRRNPNYRITQVVPYGPRGTYVIWRYEPHL